MLRGCGRTSAVFDRRGGGECNTHNWRRVFAVQSLPDAIRRAGQWTHRRKDCERLAKRLRGTEPGTMLAPNFRSIGAGPKRAMAPLLL